MPEKDNCEREEGRCLECGRPLPAGRSDMKFCSVTCKSRFNYRRRCRDRGIRLRTLNAINRNYEILEGLLEDGVENIDVPELSLMGYNFDSVTSYHKVRNRHEFRCFDIKYYKTESRVFGLCRCPLHHLPSGRQEPPPKDDSE